MELSWVEQNMHFYSRDAQKVLDFIVDSKVATLEMIVERFPKFRWANLFVILGELRREGLVTVHQRGSTLELRSCAASGREYVRMPTSLS